MPEVIPITSETVDRLPAGVDGGASTHLVDRQPENTLGSWVRLLDRPIGSVNDDTLGDRVEYIEQARLVVDQVGLGDRTVVEHDPQ